MAGCPWGDKEDQALLAAFVTGAAVTDMAAQLGRTQFKGIRQLNLIEI